MAMAMAMAEASCRERQRALPLASQQVLAVSCLGRRHLVVSVFSRASSEQDRKSVRKTIAFFTR